MKRIILLLSQPSLLHKTKMGDNFIKLIDYYPYHNYRTIIGFLEFIKISWKGKFKKLFWMMTYPLSYSLPLYIPKKPFLSSSSPYKASRRKNRNRSFHLSITSFLYFLTFFLKIKFCGSCLDLSFWVLCPFGFSWISARNRVLDLQRGGIRGFCFGLML